MTFVLGTRSRQNLIGVKPALVKVVERAITLTKQDFTVIEGLRSRARQAELFKAKKSLTMNSKHITGDAVDLAAWTRGAISWDINLYDEIADAMAEAARLERVSVKWGASWHIADIRTWNGSMKTAMDQYVSLRRSQGRRPFIDAVHFELS